MTVNRVTLATKRLWWPAAPGRVFRVPSDILTKLAPTGGPATINIR